MDRLPPVMLLLLAGCAGGDKAAAPPPSRVNAVAAAPVKERPLDEFCEKRNDAASAPTYGWPELDQAAPTPASTWTWVNVWATWCGPCVAEMPMLQKWKGRLANEGSPIDLHYLSVDAEAGDVTRFYTSNASLPRGPRVKDYALVAPWLGTVGLDANAVIPIHLFVDPQQKVRCVRLGSVEEADYATVKRVLSGA